MMERSNYLDGRYSDILRGLLNRDSGSGSSFFDKLFNCEDLINLDLRGLDVKSHGYNRGEITVPSKDQYVELCINHFEFGHHREINYAQDVPYVVSGAAGALRSILIKSKINYIGRRFWMSYSGYISKPGRRIADRSIASLMDRAASEEK